MDNAAGKSKNQRRKTKKNKNNQGLSASETAIEEAKENADN